ncbi:MAG: type II toxin-antitoxin system Phd/YefM family antitoxin [Candidatus Liptonbacteria bacterium]
MNTKNTIPISEARKKIFEIAEDIQKPGTYYILTEKGRPKAVVISAEEFESITETLDVMHEFPDLDRHIKEVERDIKSGAYKKYMTIEELGRKWGFIADKSNKKYGLRTVRHAARPKTNRKNSRKR